MKTKQILTSEEVSGVIFDYQPKEFKSLATDAAVEFSSAAQQAESDFVISEVSAEQAKITELRKKRIEEDAEAEVLNRLKDIEEKAYSEAYELGLLEGTDKAFIEKQDEMVACLEGINQLFSRLENLEKELVIRNENKIVDLVHKLSAHIAMKEIESNSEYILEVIEKVAEQQQDEEEMILHLSMEDYLFVETLREKSKKKFEPLKKLKIELDEDIEQGGCILESKYGSRDATIKQRIESAWDILMSKAPHIQKSKSQVKETVVAAPEEPVAVEESKTEEKTDIDTNSDDEGSENDS